MSGWMDQSEGGPMIGIADRKRYSRSPVPTSRLDFQISSMGLETTEASPSPDPGWLEQLEADPSARLSQIIAFYRQHKRPVELFEAIKMQTRASLGLPLVADPETPEEPPNELGRKLEEGLLDACRQAGAMLIDMGRISEGWMYLRPTGDMALVRRLLSEVPVTEENQDEMVHVLLHEGVDIARGYQAVLDFQGTCNSITLFDQHIASRSRGDRKAAAGCLLRHFYNELLMLVRDDFRSRAPQHGVAADVIAKDSSSVGLGDLIAKYNWILGEGGYHLDTTHLASTVRFAIHLDTPEDYQLAWELTQYGRRLPEDFQYPGEEPFVDFYPAHATYFAALLGRDPETAVRYFAQKARTVDVMTGGTGAIESYVDLLDRLGRPAEALAAAMALFPNDVPTQRVIADLIRMADAAKRNGDEAIIGKLERFLFERNDLLGVAAVASLK
ncbi:MAG: hypothetical protein AAGD07_06185 [Planctomycetota bacterium]